MKLFSKIYGDKGQYLIVIRGLFGMSDNWNSDELIINKHFSDFSIATIDGVGHWIHAENPERFYDEVMGFCLL